MDCDTTGVEPDFALVKFKKLAGGGYFKIINQSVPPALEALGYSPQLIEEIIAYATGRKTLFGAPFINHETLKLKGFTQETIAAAEEAVKTALGLEAVFSPWILGRDFVEKILRIPESTWSLQGFSLLKHLGFSAENIAEAEIYTCGTMGLEGAPGLKKEHYAVFDTATPSGKNGRRSISWTAHIGMMAAVQPFISGAISKTINMPNSANYEDVKGAYMLSWKNALKAVALYRDGSKLSQPLSSFAPGTDPLVDTILKVERNLELPPAFLTPAQMTPGQVSQVQSADRKAAVRGIRKPLPSRRMGYTQKAKISSHSIFIRTGEYEDGSLGEIFLDMHKEGAAFRSLLNSFAITVSLGLQYGVPLEEYVDAFTFSRFEPNGMVQGHDYVKMATSVIDYIFRDLAISYLKRNDLGQVKPEDLLSTATKSELDGSDVKQRLGEKYSAGFKPLQAGPAATGGLAGGTLPAGQKTNSSTGQSYPGGQSSLPGQAGLPSRGDSPRETTKGLSGTGSNLSSGFPGPYRPANTRQTEDGGRAFSPQLAQASVRVIDQVKTDQTGPIQNELFKFAQARIKGYEGDPCPVCGSFALRRNGTCMLCEICKNSTGCS
jgi:ribonucleoside-diphosphate reductase alpha chain